jgi:hypothetical protein
MYGVAPSLFDFRFSGPLTASSFVKKLSINAFFESVGARRDVGSGHTKRHNPFLPPPQPSIAFLIILHLLLTPACSMHFPTSAHSTFSIPELTRCLPSQTQFESRDSSQLIAVHHKSCPSLLPLSYLGRKPLRVSLEHASCCLDA